MTIAKRITSQNEARRLAIRLAAKLVKDNAGELEKLGALGDPRALLRREMKAIGAEFAAQVPPALRGTLLEEAIAEAVDRHLRPDESPAADVDEYREASPSRTLEDERELPPEEARARAGGIARFFALALAIAELGVLGWAITTHASRAEYLTAALAVGFVCALPMAIAGLTRPR